MYNAFLVVRKNYTIVRVYFTLTTTQTRLQSAEGALLEIAIADKRVVGTIFAHAISHPANIINVIFIRPESDDIATNG